MSALRKLLVVLAVIVVVLAAVGLYVLQYNNLEVDVDEAGSGVEILGPQELRLLVMLRFENTGGVDLVVPPTDFEAWADGVYVGPGRSEGVTVPSHGHAMSTAVIGVSGLSAPLAYLALTDAGEDTIRLKGEAHVDVLVFTFDFPFDKTFKVDA